MCGFVKYKRNVFKLNTGGVMATAMKITFTRGEMKSLTKPLQKIFSVICNDIFVYLTT